MPGSWWMDCCHRQQNYLHKAIGQQFVIRSHYSWTLKRGQNVWLWNEKWNDSIENVSIEKVNRYLPCKNHIMNDDSLMRMIIATCNGISLQMKLTPDRFWMGAHSKQTDKFFTVSHCIYILRNCDDHCCTLLLIWTQVQWCGSHFGCLCWDCFYYQVWSNQPVKKILKHHVQEI